MKLLMRSFEPLLSLSFLIGLVSVFLVLILSPNSVASKFLYIIQYDRNYLAKALAPKYPDVGLPSPKGPIIVDPHLKAEVVSRGLRYPTSMTFLGPNDILVTEKDAGTVRRVVNGTVLTQPLLDVSVATYGHRGLLGIAVPLLLHLLLLQPYLITMEIVILQRTFFYTILKLRLILVMILQKENNQWVTDYTSMN